MDTSFISPDPEFAHIAFSISRDPISWEGWYCLQVETQVNGKIPTESSLKSAHAIIESFFENIESKFFFVNDNIYIISKGPSLRALHDIGEQICHIHVNENQYFSHYLLYEFGKDAMTFISDLHQRKELNKTISIKYTPPALPKLNPETKILLVEDDPVTRWLVRNALKDHCSLATADTANTAYSRYAEWKPDIVFLDIGLPDTDGRVVLDWIMRNDPGATVIMFSGNDTLDAITTTLEQGAKGFMAKPFLKEKLFYYIDNYCGTA